MRCGLAWLDASTDRWHQVEAVFFVSRVIAESNVLRRIISREDFLRTLCVFAA